MNERSNQLSQLITYVQEIDKELTMMFQTLQWDRKIVTQHAPLASCKFDLNHKVPPDRLEQHEVLCHLKQQGYSDEDKMLPDPLDINAHTLVKLSKDDVKEIIEYAVKTDPSFKKGTEYGRAELSMEPLMLERLQCCYSSDERRAIHDAVVAAVPSCHDLTDLALLSNNGDGEGAGRSKPKSRLEVLAELRDMKRRRAKYRVAAKTKNYSDVLRDVIKTQMEMYADVKTEIATENKHLIAEKEKEVTINENDKHHIKSSSYQPKRKYYDNITERDRTTTYDKQSDHKYKGSVNSFRHRANKDDHRQRDSSEGKHRRYSRETVRRQDNQNHLFEVKKENESIENHNKYRDKRDRYSEQSRMSERDRFKEHGSRYRADDYSSHRYSSTKYDETCHNSSRERKRRRENDYDKNSQPEHRKIKEEKHPTYYDHPKREYESRSYKSEYESRSYKSERKS